MKTNWSQEAWETVQVEYDKILALPFIQQLADGSLDKTIFDYYIEQDTVYLEEYGKILANISSRLPQLAQRSIFMQCAQDSMQVEGDLHQVFFNKDSKEIKASPSCLLYSSYLEKLLVFEPIEVAAAAVLPCFVIYKKVGDHIYAHHQKKNNPYQDWIDTYGGDDFAEPVRMAEEICSELAANTTQEIRNKMLEAYQISTKMEWIFWNAAYNKEQWPL
ncbi:MAG: TenA family protein [Marinifilaceae bacterium]|jgi:thiaminase/transcriptional activator TenA|nr:TenA family protein [Marinifilaceae bacterium]